LVAAYLEPEDAGPEVQRLQEARFWVSREDWRLSGTTAPALRSGGPSALLTLMRPRGREPFGEEDLAFLRQLLPHVRRALDLQQRITATEARYEAAAGALDHLALGVLLLDEDGRLMGCNRAARERLAAREIRTGPGGLAASCPRETAALRSAVAKVVRAEPAEPAAREWVTTLSRPGSRPPLTAVAVPLRSGAALFVSNPDAGGVPEAVLRGLYGLSGAEARLTRLLLGGSRIEDAAAFLGVTLNTARTHLKRIFEKTGTDRQADLVRLLFGGPGALRLR
jgi:DNA-binding CsgD family transcriptional regulator